MQQILVTGANGQVGSELQALALTYPNHNFFFTDINTLDITDAAAVQQYFSQNKITACFNCAAYTAVDKAESEQEFSYLVNEIGPRNLALAAEQQQAILIHLSTDYVYHSNHNLPFKESDQTSPKSVYGCSKLAGDEAVQQCCSKAVILRTSWVYSSYGNNFVKTMLKLGVDRPQLNIIFDQIGSPTYAEDLASAMLDIFQQIQNQKVNNWQGIYHYSNEGVCSWYDFAKAIFELTNTDCQAFPIETKDYPTPAKRPAFSLLNKEKIKAHFQLEIPYWRESLKRCLKKLGY